MCFKYLHCLFNRQSLDRVSVASHRRRLKQRVVDCFLRRFDRGQKQRRHRVVGHNFHVPRQRFVIGMDPHLRRRRECDRVVSAAVRCRTSRVRHAQQRPRCEPFQVARVQRRVGCDNDHA